MKSIKFLIFTISLLSLVSMNAEAATVISRESVEPGLRKVILRQDDGTVVEKFELCDKQSSSWLPARLDGATNTWILTNSGEDAKIARQEYIRDLHLRWQREERRSSTE